MSGAHIAIEAAHRRRHTEHEEETMSQYTQTELEGGWEFKIIRAASGSYKNPVKLAAILEEEALAGWDMVEKFDDHRIRLKRPTSARRNDSMLPPGMDPYRTQYGFSEGSLTMIIIGAALALSMGVGFLITLFF